MGGGITVGGGIARIRDHRPIAGAVHRFEGDPRHRLEVLIEQLGRLEGLAPDRASLLEVLVRRVLHIHRLRA